MVRREKVLRMLSNKLYAVGSKASQNSGESVRTSMVLARHLMSASVSIYRVSLAVDQH